VTDLDTGLQARPVDVRVRVPVTDWHRLDDGWS